MQIDSHGTPWIALGGDGLHLATLVGEEWVLQTLEEREKVTSGVQLRLDAGDRPIIVWQSGHTLWYGWLADGGWHAEEGWPLATGAGAGLRLAFLQDDIGRSHILYHAAAGPATWHAVRTDGVWEHTLVSASELPLSAIAFDADRHIHLVHALDDQLVHLAQTKTGWVELPAPAVDFLVKFVGDIAFTADGSLIIVLAAGHSIYDLGLIAGEQHNSGWHWKTIQNYLYSGYMPLEKMFQLVIHPENQVLVAWQTTFHPPYSNSHHGVCTAGRTGVGEWDSHYLCRYGSVAGFSVQPVAGPYPWAATTNEESGINYHRLSENHVWSTPSLVTRSRYIHPGPFSLDSGTPDTVHLVYRESAFSWSNQHNLRQLTDHIGQSQVSMTLPHQKVFATTASADDTFFVWTCLGDRMPYCTLSVRRADGWWDPFTQDLLMKNEPFLSREQAARVHTLLPDGFHHLDTTSYRWWDGSKWQAGPAVPGFARAFGSRNDQPHVIYATRNPADQRLGSILHATLTEGGWSAVPLLTDQDMPWGYPDAALEPLSANSAAMWVRPNENRLLAVMRQGALISARELLFFSGLNPALVASGNRAWLAGVTIQQSESADTTLELVWWDGAQWRQQTLPVGNDAPDPNTAPLLAVNRSGLVTVAYRSATGDRLYAMQGSPETGWTRQALDGGDQPREISLHQQPDGTLHLVWYNAADETLRFATRWNRWESRTVWHGPVGQIRLHLRHGVPHIYFVDSARGDVRMALPAPFEVVGRAWLPIIGR
jgi:hypothetical protein